MLCALRAAMPAEAEAIEKVLDASARALSESSVFAEIGTTAKSENDAWATIQAQAQQMAAQAALMKIQEEAKARVQIKQAEIAFEIQKMKEEAELKRQLMAEEFNYNMQQAGIREDKLAERDNMKEKAKDKRVGIQNTQQSQLINQRKNNLPPQTCIRYGLTRV